MDELERRLKETPLRRPSGELRDRIFEPAAVVEEVAPLRGWSRRVSIGWAAALALLMSIAAFQAGRVSVAEPPSAAGNRVAAVKVQIVEAPPRERNLFDFTESETNPTDGVMRVLVRNRKES